LPFPEIKYLNYPKRVKIEIIRISLIKKIKKIKTTEMKN